MANYLDLPAEIRQHIVSYALLSQRVEAELEAQVPYRSVLQDLPPQGLRDILANEYGPTYSLFADDGYISNAQNMRLVCHIFDDDVTRAVRLSRRDQDQRLVYKLDLTVDNYGRVRSFWSSIPYIHRQPDVIYVNIRGCDHFDWDRWWHNNFFAHLPSAPNPWWCFYFFLEDYLFNGIWTTQTQRLRRSPHPQEGYSVKELVIKIPDGPLGILPPGRYSPDSLLAFVTQAFQEGWKHPTWVGMILERVGTLIFEYNGRQARFNVEGMLAHVYYHTRSITPNNGYHDAHGALPLRCQYPSFWNWKIRTYHNRRELGLPILPEAANRWPDYRNLRHQFRKARLNHRVIDYWNRHGASFSQEQIDAIEAATMEDWLVDHCRCRHRDMEQKFELDAFRKLSRREQLLKVVASVLLTVRVSRARKQFPYANF